MSCERKGKADCKFLVFLHSRTNGILMESLTYLCIESDGLNHHDGWLVGRLQQASHKVLKAAGVFLAVEIVDGKLMDNQAEDGRMR